MKNNKNKAIIIWLLTGCFLVAFIVIIGGITRLTHSGLSMVEWKLVSGSIPPLNEKEWQSTFEKYKQFPEYKIKHSYFQLSDFKSIFWWEFMHRNLGRFIGLVFILPFLYFLIRKKLNKQLLKKLIILLVIGGFQGFLGWFMVKSGLVNKPDVSHYRLAAHLVTALAAFSYSFWLALELLYPKDKLGFLDKTQIPTQLLKGVYILMGILVLQITYGAFVAGLKAGLFYNTFPKMGDEWIPQTINLGFKDMGIISLTENIATVQFIHRYLAIAVVVLTIYLWKIKNKFSLNTYIKNSLNIILIVVLVQFITGILTLLNAVPVPLGVVHQFGAIVVLSSGLYLTYFIKYS